VRAVSAGETLYSISRSLGVSEDDLRQWNNLDGNNIQAGQKLKYMRSGDRSAAKVASGDKPSDGDDGDDGSPMADDVKAAKMAPVVTAGFLGTPEPKPAAKEEKQYYLVKDGDSLWDISVKYKVSVQRLKELNPKLPPVLKSGTRIRVK
jgi:LysM repeat protein